MEQEDGPEGKGVRQREDVQSPAEDLVVSQMKMAHLVEFTKSKLNETVKTLTVMGPTLIWQH